MDNNMELTCRICTCNTDDVKSIFASENFSEGIREIREVILACASVQIQIADNLPKKICSKCLFYLHYAYTFRSLCENSDNKLRNHVEQIEAQTNTVNEDDEKLYRYLKNLPDTDSDQDDEKHLKSFEICNRASINKSNDLFAGDNFNSVKIEKMIEKEEIKKLYVVKSESETICEPEATKYINKSDSGQIILNEEEDLDYDEVQWHSESFDDDDDDVKNELIDVTETTIEFGDITNYNGNLNLQVEEALSKDSQDPMWVVEPIRSIEDLTKKQKSKAKKKSKKKHNKPKRQCDICHKQMTNLKRHLKTHTKDSLKLGILRPSVRSGLPSKSKITEIGLQHKESHKCHVCTKGFSNRSNLIRHVRIHAL